jgi:hypothetical protein
LFPNTEGDCDSTQAGSSHQTQYKFDAVAQKQSNAITRSHPQGMPTRGQLSDLQVQLAVTQTRVATDQCGAIRLGKHSVFKQAVKAVWSMAETTQRTLRREVVFPLLLLSTYIRHTHVNIFS